MLRYSRCLLVAWMFAVVGSSRLWSETIIESQMNTMKVALRTLKLALQTPSEADKAKYIANVDTLIGAATKARDHEPEMTSKVPEAERAQFVADYRKSIDDLIALFGKLKEQLNAGEWEAAKNQIRLINRAQGEGHEKFRYENP